VTTLFWIAAVIFWVSVGVFFYTYVGFPVLVYLLGRIRPRITKKNEFEPFVSVIITAYNEEKDISAKLENTLLVDYPKEKIEIIVASDCSSDRTDEIAASFADRGIRLYRQEGRFGKTMAQNSAVELAKGEVILFSDATTMYEPGVLKAMLPNFADASVGCVAGKLIYVDPAQTGVGAGAQSYWSYETFLKESESRACSLIGASGCLYAVRKSAYVPMYPEACSDFLIATKIYEQGLRTVYEPGAVCFEETNRQTGKELKMRVRVIGQTFTDLWRNRHAMNPFRFGFYAVQLFSHKVLRYSMPLWLILLFAAAGVLSAQSLFFALTFAAQVIFYGIAALSGLSGSSGKSKSLLAIPHYFVLANVASLIAFWRFLQGENYAVWEPIRDTAKQ
jgi:cellulose synthase/poly-beta-1,6-N-acetylglucosamine synthase-like glycosyltransferase